MHALAVYNKHYAIGHNKQKKKRREGKKEEKHPIIKIFPRGSYIMFDTFN